MLILILFIKALYTKFIKNDQMRIRSKIENRVHYFAPNAKLTLLII